MAYKINRAEVRRVMKIHRDLLSELRTVERLNKKLIANMQSSADRIIEEKVVECWLFAQI